jgi:hypothetical protein
VKFVADAEASQQKRLMLIGPDVLELFIAVDLFYPMRSCYYEFSGAVGPCGAQTGLKSMGLM